MSTESYDVDATVVELRARIRELEAELAVEPTQRWLQNWRARAEKAEAAAHKWRESLNSEHARVAELNELCACGAAESLREREEC